MKKYLMANWKMQLLNTEAIELAGELVMGLEQLGVDKTNNIETVFCAQYTALPQLSKVLVNSKIKLGAQDVFYHEKGQYTGEVSPLQLKELGVEYVIIGHSERRKFLKETDEEVNRKIKISLEHGLTPIFCVGETAEERRSNKTEVTIIRQITRGLEDVELKDDQKIIIAYEPVWAISPAPPAKPEEVSVVIKLIRHLLKDFFAPKVCQEQIITVYGGSASGENVKSFMQVDGIGGALVGGASLTKDKFLPMIEEMN